MRLLPLMAFLVACSGGEAVGPTSADVKPTAATAPAAAPEVGPDGPADIAVPAIGELSADAAVVAEGEALFVAKGCNGCHAFGSKLVGPDLTGITDRRTVTWTARMIRDPDKMTKQDPVAKDLFRSHMVQMPNQGVTDEELPKLLAYLNSKK
jgi:cytochrome c